MWLPKDEDQFSGKVAELWAGWFDRNSGVVSLFMRELREIPIAVVCSSLERLRLKSPRFPDLEEIKADVRILRMEAARERGEASDREKLLEDLSALAARRATWISPRGRDCEVEPGGLRLRRGGSQPEVFLPWADLSTLEISLVASQATVGTADAEDRAREITFQEFARSDAYEEVVQRAAARGEETAWMRRLRLRAALSARMTGVNVIESAVREPGEEP